MQAPDELGDGVFLQRVGRRRRLYRRWVRWRQRHGRCWILRGRKRGFGGRAIRRRRGAVLGGARCSGGLTLSNSGACPSAWWSSGFGAETAAAILLSSGGRSRPSTPRKITTPPTRDAPHATTPMAATAIPAPPHSGSPDGVQTAQQANARQDGGQEVRRGPNRRRQGGLAEKDRRQAEQVRLPRRPSAYNRAGRGSEHRGAAHGDTERGVEWQEPSALQRREPGGTAHSGGTLPWPRRAVQPPGTPRAAGPRNGASAISASGWATCRILPTRRRDYKRFASESSVKSRRPGKGLGICRIVVAKCCGVRPQ